MEVDILTKSTERDHVLNAWNLELIKALDDEYFAMCKFLLERCHARKDRTLETTLYVLIYGSWFEISWFKWVSSWHSGAWRFSMFFIVFCICNGLALSLIFTSFFPCLMGFSLSFSLNFHVHLWSTAKLNCLSLRRWTTLAMPGWQATREAPWMGTPTRARGTSSWWNSMPRVSTCGRASAVVRSWDYANMALQADGVRLRFRIFSMEEKHGKTLDALARSMFPVM